MSQDEVNHIWGAKDVNIEIYTSQSEIWISHVGDKIKAFWRFVSYDQYTRTSEGATYFPLLQNVQTGTGAHPASHSMGTGIFFRG